MSVETTQEVLYTVKEAAERLKVSQSFLRARLADGSLRHYRFGPGQGCIRIGESHLAAFLADRERGGSPALAGFRFTHRR
jgi:excisionase family DNA binding protein